VVKLSWLGAIVSTGIIPPVDGHLVPGSIPREGFVSKLNFGVPMDIDGKGKGKAKALPEELSPVIEIGHTMNDITNSALWSPVKNFLG
jgi:DNA replication regulator DPB11